MLTTISILTALAFAALYPLCFWVSWDQPLKDGFHKFHIGLPNIIGGIVLIFVWLIDIPLSLKITVTAWKAALLSVSSFSWKKQFPDPKLVTIPCLFGGYAFIRMQAYFIEPGWMVAFIGLLSGLIFCTSIFAMNLGHWYLNVYGLPMAHLMRATNVFGCLLGFRALWDIYFLFNSRILYDGDTVPLFTFVLRIDGFLLNIGLFFGTLFPLISVFFVREVIKLKNTQSATGILYVILCSILLGDMAYKYYLIKFGIFL